MIQSNDATSTIITRPFWAINYREITPFITFVFQDIAIHLH